MSIKEKDIKGYIKLQIPAGKANPSPPVGPALGQRGVKLMDFCKAFNAATQHLKPGQITPVVIAYDKKGAFSFVIKSPPAAVLLREHAGVERGSGTPNTKKIAVLQRAQLEEIAKTKEADLTAANLEAAVKTIAGTARSMGIEVEGL